MKKEENSYEKEQPEGRKQREEPEAVSEDQLDFYLETIENLRKERDEHYDLLLRKQAEFENFRKRVVREKEEAGIEAQSRVIRELLPILDACEKGLQSLEKETEEVSLQPYRQGYELMLKELRSLLDKFEVTEVPGTGARFDPNVHEAVLREITSDYKEGEIVDEYRKGYEIKGRLLRPSQVKVATSPDEAPVGQEQSDRREK